MEFVSLASSSHGNAYIVTDGRTKLLLECGLPFQELQKRLDYRISEVDYCLITHEHKDHSRAVRDVVGSGIPVCMSAGTAEKLNLTPADVRILEEKQTVTIGTFKVMPFMVRHDAAEPFGYLICSGEDRLLFATDTENIVYRFPGLTQIAIECNHDAARMDDREPWVYRAKRNHMDIGRLCAYLAKTDLSKVRRIYLLHLSDRNSSEPEFTRRIQTKFRIPVTVCGA